MTTLVAFFCGGIPSLLFGIKTFRALSFVSKQKIKQKKRRKKRKDEKRKVGGPLAIPALGCVHKKERSRFKCTPGESGLTGRLALTWAVGPAL